LGVACENGDLIAENLWIALEGISAPQTKIVTVPERLFSECVKKINDKIGEVFGDVAIDIGAELLNCWLLDEC